MVDSFQSFGVSFLTVWECYYVLYDVFTSVMLNRNWSTSDGSHCSMFTVFVVLFLCIPQIQN